MGMLLRLVLGELVVVLVVVLSFIIKNLIIIDF